MTTPPNFKKGVGRLATDRYDFQAHLDGVNPEGRTDFRHDALDIDMNPPVIGGATTVQGSISNIATFIAGQSGIGQGFITVGDGYDSWHAANGNINYDRTTPPLNLLLNAIFAPMLVGDPVPSEFSRIQRGGIVLIKAGTYVFNDTVIVPPGITIMGEGFGTKLVNISNLDISPLQPIPKATVTVAGATNATPIVVTTGTAVPGLVTGTTININSVLGNTAANGTWVVDVITSTQFSLRGSVGNGSYTSGGSVNTMKPIFRIAAATTLDRSTIDAAVDPNMFMFAKETRISDLILADNFVENTILGDIYYKIAQNFVGGIPLVEQMTNSNLTLENVKLLGRYNSSTVITEHAVKLNTTFADTGTILNIRKCFIDGFKVPVYFAATAGCLSFIEINNCKIRAYGNLNNDTVNAGNNCVVYINDNNANITDNYLYSNNSLTNTLTYVGALTTGTTPLQSYAKMVVANNQICMNRGSASTGVNYSYLNCNDSIAANFGTKVSSVVIGNIFEQNSGWSVSVETDTTASPQLVVNKTGIALNVPITSDVYLNGGNHETGAKYIASVSFTGTRTLLSTDYILLADTRTASVTLQLPTGISAGRIVVIKDHFGSFSTNPLVIQHLDSSAIDDYSGSKYIFTNWASFTLYFDGTNWLIL